VFAAIRYEAGARRTRSRDDYRKEEQFAHLQRWDEQMRASCSLEIAQAFVLSEDAFKKLCKLLDERIGHLEIKADCTDQLTREFKDAADLAKYENTKGKDIVNLSISARSDNHDKRSDIKFSGKGIFGVCIDISADDGVLTRLRSDITDIVSGTRPWFSIIACVDFFFLGLGLFYMMCFALIGYAAIIALRLPKVPIEAADARMSALVNGIGMVFFIGFTAIVGGTYKLRNVVFPRSVFLLGQGKDRYRIIERFQWGVIIAFLVSFTAGIALVVFLALFK
jgi:hypothetical protein